MSLDILVVDDEPEVADALREVLSAEGYEVGVAPDGLAALAHLAEVPAPAVILLDWVMPRCDGATFRSLQKADPALAQIPVVIFTADERVLGRVHDGAQVLTKPVALDDLLSVAAAYCGMARANNPKGAGAVGDGRTLRCSHPGCASTFAARGVLKDNVVNLAYTGWTMGEGPNDLRCPVHAGRASRPNYERVPDETDGGAPSRSRQPQG